MTDTEKLDKILEAMAALPQIQESVRTLADQAIRMDQNLTVVAARLDVIEDAETLQARALIGVERDLRELRDHVLDSEDRAGQRLKALEGGKGMNGHG